MEAGGLAFPDAPAAGAYHDTDDKQAVSRQLEFVAEHFPERVREFTLSAAQVVGARRCPHGDDAPPMLEEELGLAARKLAAGAHVGLCGVHHAHVIAGVRTNQVFARSGGTLAHKFRNQVSCSSVVAYGSALVTLSLDVWRDETCNGI